MKTNEIKAYAIQLNAIELTEKIDEFKEIVEEIGYIGVNPDVPYAYVLFATKEEWEQGYRELKEVFEHCKVVRNAAYIPNPKQKRGS